MNRHTPALRAMIAAVSFSATCHAGVQATDPRVEGRSGWIVTDDPEPMLSWKASADGDVPLKGWEIIAAKSSADASAGRGTLWESGLLPVADGMRRRFDAKVLPPRSEVWWRVRAIDENGGQGEWSQPAVFETGLKPGDWKAAWIGMPPEARGRSAPLFRKSFVLGKPVAKARLYVCGLGWHESWLNGAKLGDEVLQPAQTDYEERCFYVSHDVTARLREGENTLGFWVGDGFFNQDRVWAPNGLSYGQPRVIGQLEITHPDGGVTVIATDPSWMCRTSPITESNVHTGEHYDARAGDPAWATPQAAKDGWIPAVKAAAPGGALVAQNLPPCRRLETVKARPPREIKPGVWIYDFGVNLAGWAKFTVEAEPGTRLTARFAEDVLTDGSPNFETGGVRHTKAIQTDVYTCRGGGVETWEPRFTYHGFRYAELTVSGGALKSGAPGVDLLEAVAIHNDLPVTGRFECSDATLNTAFGLAHRTFISNIQGVPTDCPVRERCGWTGDAHLIVPFSMFRFDAAALWEKYTGDIVTSARRERPMLSFGLNMDDRVVKPKAAGIPTMVAPGKRAIGEATPDWGSAIVFIPWDHYLHTGDTRPLERNYDSMRQWTLHLESRATDGIVKSGLGDWCKPHPTGETENLSAFYSETVPMLSTACWFRCARITADAARLLGKAGDAERFSAMAEKIRAAFLREFYGPAPSMTPDQTIHAIAIDWEILPPEMRADAARKLADLVKRADHHFMTGVFGSPSLWPALVSNGHQETAWKALQNDTTPSLKHLARLGATTFWEVWPGPVDPRDPANPYSRSMSHPFQSGFVSWFFSGLGGIRPDPAHPGFRSVLMEPHMIDGLDWVKCSLDSPMGTIHSSWKREGKSLRWEIVLPPGSGASVRVPGRVTKIESGHETAADADAYDAQGPARRLHLKAGHHIISSSLP